VHVDRDALTILTQESLEKASSIPKLEAAATELYKALQAGRETGALRGRLAFIFASSPVAFRHGSYYGKTRRI
jgi:hypothetical protein